MIITTVKDIEKPKLDEWTAYLKHLNMIGLIMGECQHKFSWNILENVVFPLEVWRDSCCLA